MTDKPFDFKTQLAIGEQGEAFLDRYFEPTFAIVPATEWQPDAPSEQRIGIDRHFTHRKTGVEFTVEYKTDAVARKTHNAFVEVMSVDKTSKSGWAYTSQADFLIYYVPGDEVIYVIAFVTLRKHLPTWALKYPLRSALNEGYRTWGLLVPLHEFEAIAQQVYSA